MIRSTLAVVAGYLVFGLSAAALFGLSGRDPHQPADTTFTAFSVLYGAMFGLLAGYTAARIASHKPRHHAGAVAAIMIVAAIASTVASAGGGARWTQLATLFISAPMALLGGTFSRESDRLRLHQPGLR